MYVQLLQGEVLFHANVSFFLSPPPSLPDFTLHEQSGARTWVTVPESSGGVVIPTAAATRRRALMGTGMNIGGGGEHTNGDDDSSSSSSDGWGFSNVSS